MVLSLLCNHWQCLVGFSAMAKQNQRPKTKKKQKSNKPKKQKNTNHKNKTHKKNDKTQLSATTPSH